MSVHEDPPGSGIFKVRWRQGGRNRAKTFNSKKLGGRRAAERAANAFYARVETAKALDGLDELDRGRMLFSEYVEHWWSRYATRRLGEQTLDNYATQLDVRLIPQWGGWQLRQITPRAIEEWMNDLSREGVGDPTILKALSVLQGVLKRAVVDGEIRSNPCADVAKPRQRRTREPVQIPPAMVERIRRVLVDQCQLGDAMLVGFLAYAGPRPESEGIVVTWPQVRRRTIRIIASKKHGAARDVRLLAPLAEDLVAWRRFCADAAGGAVPATGLVFPFADGHVHPLGAAWTPEAWDRWRDRVFRPAALAAGLPADATRRITRRGKTRIVPTTSVRPRDLRASFATLLIYEGQTPTEVADQMGNSAATVLRDYAGVWAEYDPKDRVDAADAIRRARDPDAMRDELGTEATG